MTKVPGPLVGLGLLASYPLKFIADRQLQNSTFDACELVFPELPRLGTPRRVTEGFSKTKLISLARGDFFDLAKPFVEVITGADIRDIGEPVEVVESLRLGVRAVRRRDRMIAEQDWFAALSAEPGGKWPEPAYEEFPTLGIRIELDGRSIPSTALGTDGYWAVAMLDEDTPVSVVGRGTPPDVVRLTRPANLAAYTAPFGDLYWQLVHRALNTD